MTTQEVYIIEASTSEEAKALKMKIKKQTNPTKEGLKQAVNELNLIKENKLNGISAKDLLNEL